MQFFDCNAYFGLPALRPLAPVPTAEALLSEMDRAGVAKALVWHIAQHDTSSQTGNRLLEEAIAPYPQLHGCWTILPNQAHEYPPPRLFFEKMKAARITALRVFPDDHRFLLNMVSMGDWLEAMAEQRVPLIVSRMRGAQWRDIYALLADLPDLVCIICDHGCWGEDRLFRPLIERYPHVYVDTAYYLLDGGIESFVADYGPDRLLYGSAFPDAYFGGMMMAIKHAEIEPAAKEAIASRNLERLLGEVRL